MGCSWAIAVALWWLLHAGVARVGLIGVPFLCGVGQTFGGVGRFGGFEAWQTAALNAYKRSHCCGRGVLLSHCCGLVVAFACSVGRVKGSRKTGSTPPVVPGAAPALAKSYTTLHPYWWMVISLGISIHVVRNPIIDRGIYDSLRLYTAL